MGVRTVDDKPSDTLVVDSGEGFWTGSSTLPHLHHFVFPTRAATSRSAPAELRRDVPEDAVNGVGVVLDAELVGDGQQERVGRLDRGVLRE
jgi:hypothetical protein